MHVLFLHTNFPAQFGQIAFELADRYQYKCTFASEKSNPDTTYIRHVQFLPEQHSSAETHFGVRGFENQVWRSTAVYKALKLRPEIKPDVIVSHSGFVSPLLLRELYPNTPQIGYFEYFYHRHHSDLDFRSDLPSPREEDFLRVRLRNAQILLDLQNCEAGYSPTDFQKSQMPMEYQSKIETIFDGIDTDFWKPIDTSDRTFKGVTIPENHKVVTYVSRGFEAMRGFDLFLQVADAVCKHRSDVSVVIAGEDRVAYGGDLRFTDGLSFKDWAIRKYKPNLERLHFVGRLSPPDLCRLFSVSNVHLYWTVPFVLSWSLMNALSCECRIIASDTAPVREMVRHGHNGFLCDFFDVQGWVDRALNLLEQQDGCRQVGVCGREHVVRHYRVDHAVEKLRRLLERVVRR